LNIFNAVDTLLVSFSLSQSVIYIHYPGADPDIVGRGRCDGNSLVHDAD